MEKKQSYRYSNDLPSEDDFGALPSFRPLSGYINRIFHNETYWTTKAIKAIEDNIEIIMKKTENLNKDGSDIDITDLTVILNCFKIIDQQQNQIKRRIESLKDEAYRNLKTIRMEEYEFLEKYEKRLKHFITSFNAKYEENLQSLPQDKINIFENIFVLGNFIVYGAESILRLIALLMSAALSGGKSKRRKSKRRKSKRRKSKRRKIYV